MSYSSRWKACCHSRRRSGGLNSPELKDGVIVSASGTASAATAALICSMPWRATGLSGLIARTAARQNSASRGWGAVLARQSQACSLSGSAWVAA
jgi:hypothetical protein